MSLTPYKADVGDCVSYLAPKTSVDIDVRWRSAKVTAVTDQNNLVLAIVTSAGSRTALNGGAAVPRMTASGQTNVWRPY